MNVYHVREGAGRDLVRLQETLTWSPGDTVVEIWLIYGPEGMAAMR